MGKFDGRIFLELGSNIAGADIVKYAKSEGAYVIVTDYLPIEKSEAKLYADETAMISTLDVESLIRFAREKKIDGIFCGVSEANLRSVCKIAEALGLPCYFTKEQWELCQNKAKFKELCIKHGVPVPKQYNVTNDIAVDEMKVEFPVIVKPADRGAGIGIHICYNNEELLAGYCDAFEKSRKHEVIIEQYVVGDEFSAAYMISNSEFRLSTMGEKHLREQEGLLPLPEAYVYPSRHLVRYLEEVNDKVVKMLKDIGLKNGTVFVQGIANDREIILLEAGLRMGGTALYRFTDKINGCNMMKSLTDYALTGEMQIDLEREDPNFHGKRCCLLSLINGGGIIKEIKGVDEASKVPGVVETVVRYQVGDTILRSGTLKQSHIRFFVVRDSAAELKEAVDTIQGLVEVVDQNDDNMLLGRYDTQKLIY